MVNTMRHDLPRRSTLRARGFAAVLVHFAGCASQPPAPEIEAELEPATAAGEAAPVAEPEAPAARPEWEEIGYSVESRPLATASFGGGRPRIYVIGGIHGNEREGVSTLEELVELLWHAGGDGGSWRILWDMNPDGSERGKRFNLHGVDLNRNWPASNFRSRSDNGGQALSEPESEAAYHDLAEFAPDLLIVFHSTRGGPYVNFDGPARRLAEAFVDAAQEEDPRWRVVADVGYPTPGSLGSYFGVDRGIPVLTVEFRRGDLSPRKRLSALSGILAAARELGATPPGELSP